MIYREDGEVVPAQEKDLPVLLPVLNKNNPNPTKEEIEKWKALFAPKRNEGGQGDDTFDIFRVIMVFCRCNPRLKGLFKRRC